MRLYASTTAVFTVASFDLINDNMRRMPTKQLVTPASKPLTKKFMASWTSVSALEPSSWQTIGITSSTWLTNVNESYRYSRNKFISQWKEHWLSASVVNHTIVTTLL